MKQIVRIGAFEVRETVSLRGVPYLEVVKWYDNPLYHKFNDFEWVEDKQMFRSKNAIYDMMFHTLCEHIVNYKTSEIK